MTPDDQESLRQSIESHNQLLAELTAKMMETEEQLRRTDEQAARTDESISRMARNCDLNFERLTQAMMGLADIVGNHEVRLQRLERVVGQNPTE